MVLAMKSVTDSKIHNFLFKKIQFLTFIIIYKYFETIFIEFQVSQRSKDRVDLNLSLL